MYMYIHMYKHIFISHVCVYIYIYTHMFMYGFHYHFNNLRSKHSNKTMILQLHGLISVCFKGTFQMRVVEIIVSPPYESCQRAASLAFPFCGFPFPGQ